MIAIENEAIIEEYFQYLQAKPFPCIAAKAALAHNHIKCMVADHIACPKDDRAMISFLYNFVDEYRASSTPYHSAAIIFREPHQLTEELFETFFWHRLQSLSDIDAQHYPYDTRVDKDPSSSNFSFSIKQEGFFIIGLHPGSSRLARSFKYPTIVFNPHAEFEKLRRNGRYDQMKETVRKRDMDFSGSVNPTLKDFGEVSEVFQYSGRQHSAEWKCPLMISHAPGQKYQEKAATSKQ
ncbi:MAG: guanitoxin biosynthesis heme-dependent pre-guanitoxin N-hydroxylase GntA [Flavitalea sp.]